MRLGDRPARAIMTRRSDVDMVDLSDDPETLRRTIAESTHSRRPVIEGRTDDVRGVVQAEEILDDYLRGGAPDIRCHVRQAPIILDTADAVVRAVRMYLATVLADTLNPNLASSACIRF
jgi:putative hemolysin